MSGVLVEAHNNLGKGVMRLFLRSIVLEYFLLFCARSLPSSGRSCRLKLPLIADAKFHPLVMFGG